jgi:hypothetical protein
MDQYNYDALIVVLSGIFLYIHSLYNYGFRFDFLLTLITYLGSAYRVNCMIIGKCYTTTRYIAILTLISTIVIIYYSPLHNYKFQVF